MKPLKIVEVTPAAFLQVLKMSEPRRVSFSGLPEDAVIDSVRYIASIDTIELVVQSAEWPLVDPASELERISIIAHVTIATTEEECASPVSV